MDLSALVNKAVQSSELPEEVIASHSRMNLNDLRKMIEGDDHALDVYAVGRVFAASGARPSIVISPDDLNHIVNPLTASRPPLPRRNPRPSSGRVTLVDQYRSTPRGHAGIDGMLFSMHVSSICHNLIGYLFENRYRNNNAEFNREQAHWSDLYQGARDASFEDLLTLTAMAGGQVQVSILEEES